MQSVHPWPVCQLQRLFLFWQTSSLNRRVTASPPALVYRTQNLPLELAGFRVNSSGCLVSIPAHDRLFLSCFFHYSFALLYAPPVSGYIRLAIPFWNQWVGLSNIYWLQR